MDVRAFKALRFDPAVVGDAGLCIAPPYDVIDEQQQERLYQQSPYNVVRLDRGKEYPSDNGQENVYTRAAACQKDWIDQGVLRQDDRDAIYGYVQDFEMAGQHLCRKGFIAVAKMEDFGPIVRPHEEILTKPMMDRLYLKRATQTQLGLVFMLYEDPKAVAEKIIDKAMAKPALIDMKDEQDVRHRLYSVTAQAEVKRIVKMMADKACIIADGHHRYTTGLKFAEESGDPAARYQMMAFANTCQPGLIVLATHRLVGGAGGPDGAGLIKELKRHFEIDRYPFSSPAEKVEAKARMRGRMKALFDEDRTGFGVYFGHGDFYVAALRDGRAMEQAAPRMSPAWREVDVAILQTLVLEGCLGITAERLAQGGSVSYVKDTTSGVDDSVAKVDLGLQKVAFFLNPIKIRQLVAVTDAGQRMPQKSTFFYPKMFTGLTIQKLEPMDLSPMASTKRSQDRR
jgi:uncharacterized protein (DUF1015 family)